MHRIVWIIPYAVLCFSSAQSPEEVAARLRERTRPRRSLSEFLDRFGEEDRTEFLGTVETHRFKISRRIGYHNAFLPVVTGTIQPDASGSVVRAVLRPPWISVAVLLAWFALTAPGAIRAVRTLFAGRPLDVYDRYSLLLLAAGYAVMEIAFLIEALQIRHTLRQLVSMRGDGA